MKIIKIGAVSIFAFLAISCNNSTKTNTPEDKEVTKVNNEITTEEKTETITSPSVSKGIAYINVDSMLLNYKYYKELEKKLTAKYNRAENEFNKKRSDLEKEVMAFKQKEAANGFLSQESYQMQGQQLMQKEQELQELNLKLSQDLEQHKMDLDKQIQDTIYNFINNWNKQAGYDFILTKGAIIYAKKGADITPTILDLLNKRYDEQHKKDTK
jgi:outer membrane protein